MPSETPKPSPLRPSEAEQFLSAEQVVARLGLTHRRLSSLVQRGLVKYRGCGRDPFFLSTDLSAILAAAMGEPKATEPETLVPLKVTEANARGRNGRHDHPAKAEPYEVDRLIHGDALSELREMPPDFVQSVVTSPPFWGQRLYEDETPVEWESGAGPIPFGREATPEEYVDHSIEIFGELSRVLKPRGTIWWNVGDSYFTRTILNGNSLDRILRYGGQRRSWARAPAKRSSSGHGYLKDKDLTLVPFLVAYGAQRLGLWLRSIIIWSKQQPEDSRLATGSREIRTHMPEPVADRPVTGHEYILLFAKSESYDYYPANLCSANGDVTNLNVRTVWNFRPADKGGRHGARFPEELPRRCIALGTNPGDLVLDPFAGYATTLRVAASMERRYLGIEISRTYVEEARAGLSQLRLDQASSTGSATPTER